MSNVTGADSAQKAVPPAPPVVIPPPPPPIPPADCAPSAPASGRFAPTAGKVGPAGSGIGTSRLSLPGLPAVATNKAVAAPAAATPAAPATPIPSYQETFAGQSYVKDGSNPQLVGLMKQAAEKSPELKAGAFGKAAEQGHVTPEHVKELQTMLRAKGYSVGKTGVDGKFGPKTHQALQDFLAGKPPAPQAPVTPQHTGKPVPGAKPAPAKPGDHDHDHDHAAHGADAHDDKGSTVGGVPTVERQGIRMHKNIAADFDRMAAAAKKDGVDLKLNSGHRTVAEQKVLWDAAVKKYGPVRARKWVAPPGKSNHQHGNALDISKANGAHAWLRANGAKFGFKQPMSWEPWHWEHKI